MENNTMQSAVDSFLEKESKKNKTDTWNKIDKTSKIKQLNEIEEQKQHLTKEFFENKTHKDM